MALSTKEQVSCLSKTIVELFLLLTAVAAQAEVSLIERTVRQEVMKNVAMATMAENLQKLRNVVDKLVDARQLENTDALPDNLEGNFRVISKAIFGSKLDSNVDDFAKKSVVELRVILQSVDRLLDNIYSQMPMLSRSGKVTREEPVVQRIHGVLTHPQSVVQSLINNDREKLRKKESVERMMRIMEERGRK